MNKNARENHFSFFRQVGASLCTRPAESESQEAFIQRVILSAVSKWMLTSVYSGDGKTSVVNIRNTAREKVNAFLEIAAMQTIVEPETVVEHIYDTLLKNGMFYHQQYYVMPVENQLIGHGKIAIIRGLLPDEHAFFSGLAPCTTAKQNDDIAEEFDLWNMDATETISLVWENSARTSGELHIEEWLHLNRKDTEPYYIEKRRDQNNITLGRSRKSMIPNDYLYYIVRGKEIRRITEDYLESSIQDHVRVAIMNASRPQKIWYRNDNGKTTIRIGYLPSRSEVRVIRLIAWPEDLRHLDNPFNISVYPDLFPVLENRFRFLGYQMEEVNHE